MPSDLQPFYYDLTLKPFFKVTTTPENYTADINIHFTCVSNTNRLVLHMKDLDIFNSSLKLTSTSDSLFTDLVNFPWTYDNVTHFFVVQLQGQTFKASKNYTFSASFRGYTKNDDLGFYRSSYTDNNNQKSLSSFKEIL